MLAFIKRRQLILPLLTCFVFVLSLLFRFLLLARSQSKDATTVQLRRPPETPLLTITPLGHAQRVQLPWIQTTTAFPTQPNCKASWTAKTFAAGSRSSPKVSFTISANNGTRNKETAPDWCGLPGAKPCAVTTAPGCKRWGQATRRVAPDVARYTLEQGPLGEKLFRTALWFLQRWRVV